MIKTFKEHSEVPVPLWLQAHGTDGSWHNDAMPHAWIWQDEATFRGVEIWINFDDLEEREVGGGKWEILLMENENQFHNQNGEVLYEGEDEAEAIKAVNRGLGQLGSPLRIGGPIAGVWTPWADVLCRICHDALGAEVTAKRQVKWPGPADPTAAKGAEERREGDGQGFCTQCGAAVWVSEDIAQLSRLLKLTGGVLEQTGGMCAALTVGRLDGGTVVVTNMDGSILIGSFAQGEWEEGQEANQYYTIPGGTPDETSAAVILAAVREKKEAK